MVPGHSQTHDCSPSRTIFIYASNSYDERVKAPRKTARTHRMDDSIRAAHGRRVWETGKRPKALHR
jgi:hypothetical protein